MAEPRRGREPRKLIKIDAEGNILAHVASIKTAAAESGMSYQMVLSRCLRRVKDEFIEEGYSYRYEDDPEV